LANPENLDQYKNDLKNIEKFLSGKKRDVEKKLLSEQKKYIKEENFEMASIIQKQLEGIQLITSPTFDPFLYIQKPDFYFERIEKEKKSLEEILRPYYPEIKSLNRIECYDISNFQGKQATGSMVVFINGEKRSSAYRRFKIKTKDTPDDFHMMREMLTRRLGNDWQIPDLMVIDGGKGQVGSALRVLAGKNKRIPVVGLAKREEIIVVPLKKPGGVLFEEVKLSNSTPGVNLLRRIRDEAHRFAITYHRLLRKKKMLPTG
jgi:excinuclease ABC subunit C